ncbi:MAG: hypothetical protein U0O24_00425, partial [Eggerthellaceae bacterium]
SSAFFLDAAALFAFADSFFADSFLAAVFFAGAFLALDCVFFAVVFLAGAFLVLLSVSSFDTFVLDSDTCEEAFATLFPSYASKN